MKKWIFVCAACVLGTTLSFAQSNGKAAAKGKPKTESTSKAESKPKKEVEKAKQTPAQKTAEIVSKMKAACNLSAEQVSKIEAAYLEYYQKHEALKKQKDVLSKTVFEERVDALKKTRNTVLKSTLTATQYKQWQTAKAKDDKAKDKGSDKKESDEE